MGEIAVQRVRAIIKQQPCLVCGVADGIDCAHYPRRQAQGAGWGLLEVLPLCRYHHRLLDDYVAPWPEIIATLASDFHSRMLSCYTDVVYMGPEERVEEVVRYGRLV